MKRGQQFRKKRFIPISSCGFVYIRNYYLYVTIGVFSMRGHDDSFLYWPSVENRKPRLTTKHGEFEFHVCIAGPMKKSTLTAVKCFLTFFVFDRNYQLELVYSDGHIHTSTRPFSVCNTHRDSSTGLEMELFLMILSKIMFTSYCTCAVRSSSFVW